MSDVEAAETADSTHHVDLSVLLFVIHVILIRDHIMRTVQWILLARCIHTPVFFNVSK